ncbi:MAG: hypothetical protein RLZZ450_3280 [Pseudomonadota bacterium]|jgi:glutathione S-transferase
MYTLYHFPFSQHARRVVSLLSEAGLEYELRHIEMAEGQHLSAEYLAINPNHQVPTLVDGDLRLHESNAILRYLCNKHGLKEWYPEEARRRAEVDQWLDWNQCRLSPAVVDIVLNTVFLGAQGDQAAIARGHKKLDELRPTLDDGMGERPFLVGDRATIADLSLASNLFQLGLAGVVLAGERTQRWYERVCSLEGFQRSLPKA